VADLLQRPPRKRRRRYGAYAALALLGVLVVEVAALAVLKVRRLHREREAVAARVEELQPRVMAVDEARDDVTRMEEELANRRDSVAQRVSVLTLLRDVGEGLDKDSYLTSFSVYQGERINLTGWSLSVNEIPGRLEPLPSVRNVDTPRVSNTRDGYKQFSLKAYVEY
jgi:hypothetical protein